MMMMIVLSNRKTVFTAYLIFIILCLLSYSTHLAGAEFANIIIRSSANELLVDIKLKGVFTREMETAVSKGLPIDITFSVSLYEVHNLWFDHKMISKTAMHQIRFDTLKREYKIRRFWEKRGFRTVKNSEAAQRILSEIIGLSVIPLKRLKKETQYQLRIKSELEDRSFLFSGTPWEFETDWYTINFIY
jgi:hypothetical protein